MPAEGASVPAALRTAVVALALAVAAVLAHVAWLAWDTTYQVDAVTGARTGPYEVWQVVACVFTLAVIAVLAGAARRTSEALAVVPLAFTVAWSVPFARLDDSGLWGVGAVMILSGLLAGVAVVAGGVQRLVERERRPGSWDERRTAAGAAHDPGTPAARDPGTCCAPEASPVPLAVRG